MARSLKIKSPSSSELHQLNQLLCQDLTRQVHRRAQAILLYGEGLTGVEIAKSVNAHPLTIYQDLRLFDKHGLACLQNTKRRGREKQLTDDQEQRICRLAEQSPIELGQAFSWWSLSKLRRYLIKERIVRQISREHLRRVLKKGGCVLPVSVAK